MQFELKLFRSLQLRPGTSCYCTLLDHLSIPGWSNNLQNRHEVWLPSTQISPTICAILFQISRQGCSWNSLSRRWTNKGELLQSTRRAQADSNLVQQLVYRHEGPPTQEVHFCLSNASLVAPRNA